MRARFEICRFRLTLRFWLTLARFCTSMGRAMKNQAIEYAMRGKYNLMVESAFASSEWLNRSDACLDRAREIIKSQERAWQGGAWWKNA